MSTAADLSIVIPVYNEGHKFTFLLEKIRREIGSDPEILVCYDFDEDDTLPHVRGFLKNLQGLRLIKNRYRPGPAGAIRSGFEAAARSAVLVLMGDLSDDLASVRPMLTLFDEGCQVAAASRYMPGGRQVGGPWLKKMLSRLAGVSLHYVTGLATHDATNNFKLYGRDFLKRIEIESEGGFEIALELTVKAFRAGLKIGEVPTTWTDRSNGTSRFRLWNWLPKYLRWYAFALFCSGKQIF